MKEQIEQIKVNALKEIEQAKDLKELNEVNVKYLGKKGELTAVLRGMGALSAEERPVIGSLVNVVRDEIQSELNNKEEKFKAEDLVDFLAKEKLDIWNQCDSNVVVEQFINKYNQMFEEQGKLQQEKELCSQKQSLAEQIFKNVQSQMENHIKEAFGGVTINQIYSKIQPHKRFKQLQYQINMNEDSAPELYIKVKNDESEDIMPELFFSSAQLNTVALSVFLGGALSKSNPKVNTIFIDDPIGHFDDLNILSFIDVLRTIITETNWQIIISTHEENFYEVMKIKLNSKYYNSKFFKFKDEGNIEEDMEG